MQRFNKTAAPVAAPRGPRRGHTAAVRRLAWIGCVAIGAHAAAPVAAETAQSPASETVAAAQYCPPPAPPCNCAPPPAGAPCPTAPSSPPLAPTPAEPAYPPGFEIPEGFDTPAPSADSAAPEAAPPAPTASPPSSLPSGMGAVAAAGSPDVNMIGDFFASGYFLGADGEFTNASSAAGDRRFKATDNLSPFPQDRIFFNYHHFHNAVTDLFGGEHDIDRFTFGYERTFFDKALSLELRIPFAGGLDATQAIDSPDTTSTEFGNISLTLKACLWERCGWNLISGIATVFPTADDASVTGFSSISVLENEAVHLQPYVGIAYARPCSRLFTTAYGAFDFDANGNEIFTGIIPVSGGPAPPLTSLGSVRDQTLLFFDWQIGYWVYQDYGHIGYLNGIAPILELHYTQTIDDAVNLASVYENPFGQVDLLNITAGLVFDFRQAATVTVYGAAPLRREFADIAGRVVSPVFDAEFGVQCVYRY